MERVNDLVSVVVPAYNAVRTLDATLASARAQTHANLEILVVDDGSKDDTAALAERHAAQDTRVRVLRKPNGGVADARNHGLRASCGAFIAPLDSDDLWRPDKIARQLAALRAAGPSASFAYCLSHMIDPEDRVIGVVGWPGFEGAVFLRSVLVNFVANGSVMLIRREAALRVGGYDRTRALQGTEDRLFQTLLARTGPVAVVSEHLVGYRRIPGSVSGDPVRMLNAQLCAFERLRAAAPDTPGWLLDAAEAQARIRLAMLLARKGRLGAGLAEAGRALRRAPGFALDVALSDVRRAAAKKRHLARMDGPTPLFFEADPARSDHPVDPLPGRRLLARLAAMEADHAARPVRDEAFGALLTDPAAV